MTFPPDLATFAIAKPAIKRWESFQAKPYLCPAGKPTIFWGCTRYPDGRAVTLNDKPWDGDTTFPEVCLTSAMVRVRASLEPLVTRALTVHQAAALISLGFNIGVGVRDGLKGDLADSTLLADLNAGSLEACADQFLVWDKAHVYGVLTELPGLKSRRAEERTMFLTADVQGVAS